MIGQLAVTLAGGLALLAAAAAAGAAQDIPSADVKILFIQAEANEGTFQCTAYVHNDNDDASRSTKLIFLLPLEVQFLSASRSSCTPGPSFGANGAQGYVKCSLGSLGPEFIKGTTIVTTVPPPPRSKHCGALVWNDVPDPNPENNSGTSTVP